MIHSMIFFPEKEHYAKPADFGLHAEDVYLVTQDEVKLHAWFFEAKREIPEENRKVILLLHGNAGNISGRLHKVSGWLTRSFSVLLLDYRGYGKSEGIISHENDLARDAQAAVKWLRDENVATQENIILYGESLGSYPATRLATEEKYHTLILEAPFTSFIELAGKHYPMIPGKEMLLRNYRFANVEIISKLKTPVFILHGTADETCPYAMGQTLFNLAPEPKQMLTIPGGGHSDLPDRLRDDFWAKPSEFILRKSQGTGS